MSDDHDYVADLASLITNAGARVSFDPQRSNTHPCFHCGAKPLLAHKLVPVGSYIIATQGGILPKDKMVRPACDRCREALGL